MKGSQAARTGYWRPATDPAAGFTRRRKIRRRPRRKIESILGARVISRCLRSCRRMEAWWRCWRWKAFWGCLGAGERGSPTRRRGICWREGAREGLYRDRFQRWGVSEGLGVRRRERSMRRGRRNGFGRMWWWLMGRSIKAEGGDYCMRVRGRCWTWLLTSLSRMDSLGRRTRYHLSIQRWKLPLRSYELRQKLVTSVAWWDYRLLMDLGTMESSLPLPLDVPVLHVICQMLIAFRL